MTQANLLLKDDADGSDLIFYPTPTDNPKALAWRTNLPVSLDAQYRVEMRTGQRDKKNRLMSNLQVAIPIQEVVPEGSVNAAGVHAQPRIADELAISVTVYDPTTFSSAATRAKLLRLLAHLIGGGGAGSGGFLVAGSSTAGLFVGALPANVVPYGVVQQLWPMS